MNKKLNINKEAAEVIAIEGSDKFAMVRMALENAGYKEIQFIKSKFSATTEDNGGKPKAISELVASLCPVKNGMRAYQLNIRRREGRLHFDFSKMFGDNTPLTVDREIPLLINDETNEVDERMGSIYTYVYDMFYELHGTYPDTLSHPDDYRRLGRMMNLALIGHYFNV